LFQSSDDFSYSLVEQEQGLQLDPLYLTKEGQCFGVDSVRGFSAEIIDAEDVARGEDTPLQPQEKAAAGIPPPLRQANPKEEVDEQEIPVIMVFEAPPTTGASFQGLALGAGLNKARIQHPGRGGLGGRSKT
jgi:hypothetical protein